MNKSFIIIFIFVILFISNHSAFPQTNKANPGYGTLVVFKIKEKVMFSDSLFITLTSFSHKHPMLDGPTKATAYLNVIRGKVKDDITLSVHGIEGKSEEEFETLKWKEYTFVLKKFDYDTSVSVVVSKKKN